MGETDVRGNHRVMRQVVMKGFHGASGTQVMRQVTPLGQAEEVSQGYLGTF